MEAGMSELTCRIKPYLQPFEKTLATLELFSLARIRSELKLDRVLKSNGFRIDVQVPVHVLTRRLTYWESISDGRDNLTTQVLREATVNIVKNGISPEGIAKYFPLDHNVPLPGRRCLRYGPHGIHEYRGKFFPQLARSLANIADLKKKDTVLDPMCGSGTALVETVLLGCKALGLDANPLSVLMSKVKCEILSVEPHTILKEYKALVKKTENNPSDFSESWSNNLPQKDMEYLKSWFPESVLSYLLSVMYQISEIRIPTIRNLFTLCLSNILRRVSYQKSDDLRVRKELYDDKEIDCPSIFLGELERIVKLVLAFLYGENKHYNNTWSVQQGDSREISRFFPEYVRKVNAIITSPPYATALPYIDTDRLSLCFLGLLPRSQFREMNLKMIGNREITKKLKVEYWGRYKVQKHTLPDAVCNLIDSVYRLNDNSEAGFRRKNLPSLLSKYFLDMREVLVEMKKMLALGAHAYVVIGKNHTIAGGRKVDIKTDMFLGQMGESIGLKLENTISMDMLVSRDIFKKNAVASETILCFRNP
jgi:site-specific DNA-methyltransferase (cytosine-N4-specific)